MKIQLQSDLHLEFAEFEANYSQADVLILAGDIHVGTKGLEWALSLNLDIPVIYVAGNHEFYNHGYPSLLSECRQVCQGSQVHFLENESLVLDGVAFHGATLWTDFKVLGNAAIAETMAKFTMPDYNAIWHDTDQDDFSPHHSIAIHHESLAWLKKQLESSAAPKNVVVTHHGPSLESSAECFKRDDMTAAFVSSLEGFIKTHKPDYWFHGHCHNYSDYPVGDCRVLCNPRGYPKEQGTAFVQEMLVEV